MSGKRLALIIANSEFAENSGFKNLAAPTQDAESLARILSDSALGNFEVETVINKSSEVVKHAIESFFTDNKRDDLLLLYFSTHGFKDNKGQLNFAAKNTVKNRSLTTAISAQFVKDAMANTSNRSKTKVLLLDCCYSAAFTRGGMKGNENNDVIESFQGSGTYIISASNATLPAHEEDENNKQSEDIHSIFTRAIVNGIETGGADLDRDGNITLDELYDYVYEQVREVNPEQTPQKSSFDAQGKILIAKNPISIVTSVDVIDEDSKIESPVELLYTLPLDKTDNLAWSPDGTMLASSKEKTIYIWDGETGDLISEIEAKNKIECFAWSNDSENISLVYSEKIYNFQDYEENKILSLYKLKSNSLKHLKIIINKKITEYTLEYTLLSLNDNFLVGIINEQNTSRINFINLKLHHLTSVSHIFHSHNILCCSWSPDNTIFAFGDSSGIIGFLSKIDNHLPGLRKISEKNISFLEWSSDSKLLAIASEDKKISIFVLNLEQVTTFLEGHIEPIEDLSFSHNSQLLISNSRDKTIIWKCKTWEIIAIFKNESFIESRDNIITFWGQEFRARRRRRRTLSIDKNCKITFNQGNQKQNILATSFGVWKINSQLLLKLDKGRSFIIERKTNLENDELFSLKVTLKILHTEYYTNAKIVLVGDSGVGKSGLGLVLTGQEYQKTDSTHGRHVWTLEDKNVETSKGRTETHETLLWDLAGQPGYRLIHQLHLNEVAVALIIFDARSETDPFAGVRHWERALRQARRLQSKSASPLKKYLVAARSDIGGIGVSQQRIDKIIKDLNFDGYFETSAKEGWQIPELIDKLQKAIDWENIPKVSSTRLFQRIKRFLIEEKEAERLLPGEDDLYRSFLQMNSNIEGTKELRGQFKTCIDLVESRGLIRQLSFNNFILLQPELLDTYASAIVIAAKDEPDGLGCIAEEDVKQGRFRLSQNERVPDKEQEKLLLIATAEDLVRYEIALREQSEDGQYLVFPSQFTREYPDAPDPEGKAVIFKFEGAVLNIYATLAVRLAHSGLFEKEMMYRNAAKYEAKVGGICGMFLRELEEGRGELTLFFDNRASEETRYQFEDYIHTHLKRRAIQDSVSRQRIFKCNNCGYPIDRVLVKRKKEKNINSIICPDCGQVEISLLDKKERLNILSSETISKMDRAADEQKELATASFTIQGKVETQDYDVLFIYNSNDTKSIANIEQLLKKKSILPLLFPWDEQIGNCETEEIKQKFEKIDLAVAFIGNKKPRFWQNIEMQACIDKYKTQNVFIAAILPYVKRKPKLPIYLENYVIDFRKAQPDPIKYLVSIINAINR